MMNSSSARRIESVEHGGSQRVSLIGRAVSWVILKLLAMTLITVVAGLMFAIYKGVEPDEVVTQPPPPYSPAAVAASPVPPIDYHLHPPPGFSDNLPLPSLPPRSAPVSAAGHGAPHRQGAHQPITR